MLYVADNPNRSRADRFVFTLFLTDVGGRLNLDIQNNARFALSKDADKGVSFQDPPLGGTWTQEHLASAVKNIEKRPKVTLQMNELLTGGSSVDCTAYTDPPAEPAPR